MRDPIIIAARRTPIATRNRGLAQADVAALGSAVVRAALDDAIALGVSEPVADVVLGNCMGPGGNPGRLAALGAGFGIEVPGATIDRQCGSGLAAIIDAANAFRADGRLRIAGGVESASTAPTRSLDGAAYSRAPFAPAGFADPDMLQAADDLARHDGLSRERQDSHAVRSHQRAFAAQAAGRFDAEIVPLAGFATDDSIREDTRAISRMPAVIADGGVSGGTVTGGNSSRICDGAAAVVLAPAGPCRALNIPGLAVRASAVVGIDPALPGIGAAAAIADLLERTGYTTADIAAFEIVEAFASQSLAVLDRLGLDEADPRVCADGGAIALGHPWGASAAVSVVRLFSRLVRQGTADQTPAGTLGIAAASVGGGLGVAALFEVVR